MEWKEEWGKGEREGEKLGILSSLRKRKKEGGGGEVEWEKGKRRGEGQFLDAFDGDTDV